MSTLGQMKRESRISGLSLFWNIVTFQPPVALSPPLTQESVKLGRLIAQLRRVIRMKQFEAAERAGIARSSASRIEQGDGTVAFGLVLRYLNAISPGTTLKELLNETVQSVAVHPAPEKRLRVRSKHNKS